MMEMVMQFPCPFILIYQFSGSINSITINFNWRESTQKMKRWCATSMDIKSSCIGYVQCLAISAILVFLSFIFQHNLSLTFSDEGFLWYGSIETLLGKVPLLDFYAYDPGRYYWTSAVMWLLGNDGIVIQRLAISLFQIIGLSLALYCISTVDMRSNSKWFIVTFSIILFFWMIPQYKIIDISLSIITYTALLFYLNRPGSRRLFILGCVIGGVAFFGRNHGLYGFVSSILIIFYQNLTIKNNRPLNNVLVFISGVFLGFSPIFIMMIFIPGFYHAFIDSVLLIFNQGTTNLTKTVPWPWTIPVLKGGINNYLYQFFLGTLFVLYPLYSFFTVISAIYFKIKRTPLANYLVVSGFLSLTYIHVAFSRADSYHLTQSIFPLLLGLLCFISSLKGKKAYSYVAFVFFVSIFFMYRHQPLSQCFLPNKKCTIASVGNDDIYVQNGSVKVLNMAKYYMDKYVEADDSILVVPAWPIIYAIWEKESPVWDTYAFFDRNQKFQEVEINRIKVSNPRLVIINNVALDGKDKFRYSNTHNLIFNYIENNFVEVKEYPTSPDIHIYVRKN